MSAQRKDKALVRKWVRALRSGRYKQTHNTLVNSPDETKLVVSRSSFCCHGVLCAVAGLPLPTYDGRELLQEFREGRALKRRVGMTGVRLKDFNGYDKSAESALASMNDRGKSFREIADVIEEKLL